MWRNYHKGVSETEATKPLFFLTQQTAYDIVSMTALVLARSPRAFVFC